LCVNQEAQAQPFRTASAAGGRGRGAPNGWQVCGAPPRDERTLLYTGGGDFGSGGERSVSASTTVITERLNIRSISLVPCPVDRAVASTARPLSLPAVGDRWQLHQREAWVVQPDHSFRTEECEDSRGVWRKRGVIASEADIPFPSPIAALRYHLLPALLRRLSPASAGRSLNGLPGTAVRCRKCPVEEPAGRMETAAAKPSAARGSTAIARGAGRIGRLAAFADAALDTMSQPPSAARRP
jgi:hypothetical protein